MKPQIEVNFTGNRVDVRDENRKRLAYSMTFNGKRYLFKSESDIVEAPDFTVSKVRNKEWALYLMNKYFPELVGRTLANNYSQVYREENIGKIGDVVNEPKRKKRDDYGTNVERVFEPGKILVSSWGYEQTNIDFYKIVSRTEKSVRIVKLSQTRTNDDPGAPMCEYVIPDNHVHPNAKVMAKRIKSSNGKENCVKINSFAYAYLWNGEPEFQSHWH